MRGAVQYITGLSSCHLYLNSLEYWVCLSLRIQPRTPALSLRPFCVDIQLPNKINVGTDFSRPNTVVMSQVSSCKRSDNLIMRLWPWLLLSLGPWFRHLR